MKSWQVWFLFSLKEKYFDIFNILSHGFWAKIYSLDLKYPFHREFYPFETLHFGKTGAP